MLHTVSAGVPRLFQAETFTAKSFAEAVNHFIALGQDAAVEELRGLTLDRDTDFALHGNGAWSVNERVGWVCRVLFEAKAKEPLRPPAFGALAALPESTMPHKDWPLYPVVLSGSTYFVLSEGYSLAGRAEDPKAYIEYCRQTGVFRKDSVTVPTKAQALKDAAALRQSTAWKAIKWKDSGVGWSYTLSETGTWEFVQNQAETIP